MSRHNTHIRAADSMDDVASDPSAPDDVAERAFMNALGCEHTPAHAVGVCDCWRADDDACESNCCIRICATHAGTGVEDDADSCDDADNDDDSHADAGDDGASVGVSSASSASSVNSSVPAPAFRFEHVRGEIDAADDTVHVTVFRTLPTRIYSVSVMRHNLPTLLYSWQNRRRCHSAPAAAVTTAATATDGSSTPMRSCITLSVPDASSVVGIVACSVAARSALHQLREMISHALAATE